MQPNVETRTEALEVLDKALKEACDAGMGNKWNDLQGDNFRIPLVVNCGTAGSGKTYQLKLAMQHFEKSPMSDVPRGKALYIKFNGGDIEPGVKMTAEDQVCDKEESPKIRIYLRVLYSAVCYRGAKDVALADVAAAVVSHLKSLKPKCAREVVRACSALLQLKPGENILVAADELAKLGKQRAVASLVDRQGNRELGALYVCASAYTAYNPAKGITEGSNRRVYYMPLPPLSVEMDDEKLKKLYSGPALTCAHSVLWSSQYNARANGKVLRNLVRVPS
ncbi:hypothetical protein EMCRGX_G005181 [Ephydatia muelleri]